MTPTPDITTISLEELRGLARRAQESGSRRHGSRYYFRYLASVPVFPSVMERSGSDMLPVSEGYLAYCPMVMDGVRRDAWKFEDVIILT